MRVVPHGERIPAVVIRPERTSGDVVIWPHAEGKRALFTEAGDVAPLVRAQVGRGATVIAADLFGQGEATADGLPLRENPRVQYPGTTDKEADRWRLDPSYAYGYNPAVTILPSADLGAALAGE